MITWYLYRNSVYFKICRIEFNIVSSLGDVCYTGCILVEEENTMVGLLREEMLSDFANYVETCGYHILPVSKNPYEVFRASKKFSTDGSTDLIVLFKKNNGVITSSDKDANLIRSFLKESKKYGLEQTGVAVPPKTEDDTKKIHREDYIRAIESGLVLLTGNDVNIALNTVVAMAIDGKSPEERVDMISNLVGDLTNHDLVSLYHMLKAMVKNV